MTFVARTRKGSSRAEMSAGPLERTRQSTVGSKRDTLEGRANTEVQLVAGC